METDADIQDDAFHWQLLMEKWQTTQLMGTPGAACSQAAAGAVLPVLALEDLPIFSCGFRWL